MIVIIGIFNHNDSASQKFLAFLGPGLLVAVGYMDPGNWITSHYD
jgi:manganese transport protein